MGEDKTPSGTTVRGPAIQRHFVRHVEEKGVTPLICLSTGKVNFAVDDVEDMRTILRLGARYNGESFVGDVGGTGVYSTGHVAIGVKFD